MSKYKRRIMPPILLVTYPNIDIKRSLIAVDLSVDNFVYFITEI